MNSLHLYYLEQKNSRMAKKEDQAAVVITSRFGMPKSANLKESVIASYRSHKYNYGGVKKRPLVPLELG
jgi:hypothetical protein